MPPAGNDLGRHRFGGIGRDIVDDHARALARKKQRVLAPEPAARAGDDRDAAIDRVFHYFPLPFLLAGADREEARGHERGHALLHRGEVFGLAVAAPTACRCGRCARASASARRSRSDSPRRCPPRRSPAAPSSAARSAAAPPDRTARPSARRPTPACWPPARRARRNSSSSRRPGYRGRGRCRGTRAARLRRSACPLVSASYSSSASMRRVLVTTARRANTASNSFFLSTK